MKTILSFTLSFFSLILNAQNFEWAKSFGGSSNDLGNSIAVDAAGNVYTTGYFSGTVDFDPGAGISNLTSAGQFDVFVQKLDASGNYQWARSFGGSLTDVGQSIAIDASGNVYITGYFRGTADFDPSAGNANLISNGQDDVFVLKLDASGNYLWARSFSGTSSETANSITVDALGNAYTVGVFQGTVDFDPSSAIANLSSVGQEDIFIQKLDPSGNFLWAKTIGNSNSDGGLSAACDVLGNVYATGRFRGTVDFDPGPGSVNLGSAGEDDVFVLKLDASGNFQWARSFGNTSMDIGTSITIDESGAVYTAGYFRGTVDFDPSVGVANLSSAGLDDVFIQKLDASGNFLWAKSFGGNGADQVFSVAHDALGNVYTTGFFEGTVDFDPAAGITNLTSGGLFIQKLDEAGNFQWARSFGAVGISIAVDGLESVYTTGYYIGTVDFDPNAETANLTSAGSTDVFVSKLSQCILPPAPTASAPASICAGNTATITPTGGGANYRFYTEATGGSPLTGGNGVSTFTTPVLEGTTTFYVASVSAQGCESSTRTSITVTVNESSTGLQTETSCGSYTWPANALTYNTSGSYSTTLTNAAGCDSVVTLNLTINAVSNIGTSTSDLTITANNAGATYQWLDCNNGNAPIAGETNQSFTATVSGSYAVELLENGCVDTSACVTILVTGISGNFMQPQIEVFPNPFEDKLRIQSSSNCRVELLNLNGAVLGSGEIQQSETIIPTDKLSAGLYFLRITTQTATHIKKVIKN